MRNSREKKEKKHNREFAEKKFGEKINERGSMLFPNNHIDKSYVISV